MYYKGLIIAISTFLIIGFFHPIVIKVEYKWGVRPWWVFLLVGVVSIVGSLFIEDVMLSSLLGVFGASSLWTIGELFSQKKRVEKGWFPMNPKRKDRYDVIAPDETLCPVRHGKSVYAVDKDKEKVAE